MSKIISVQAYLPSPHYSYTSYPEYLYQYNVGIVIFVILYGIRTLLRNLVTLPSLWPWYPKFFVLYLIIDQAVFSPDVYCKNICKRYLIQLLNLMSTVNLSFRRRKTILLYVEQK